jgi:hypothetical protein
MKKYSIIVIYPGMRQSEYKIFSPRFDRSGESYIFYNDVNASFKTEMFLCPASLTIIEKIEDCDSDQKAYVEKR